MEWYKLSWYLLHTHTHTRTEMIETQKLVVVFQSQVTKYVFVCRSSNGESRVTVLFSKIYNDPSACG